MGFEPQLTMCYTPFLHQQLQEILVPIMWMCVVADELRREDTL